MGKSLIAAAIFLSAAVSADAQDLVFKENGLEISVLDFGEVTQGEPVVRSIEVYNKSGHMLELLDVSTSGAITKGQLSVDVQWCPVFLLDNNQSCGITVIFYPGRPGKFRGAIDVATSVFNALVPVYIDGSLQVRGQDIPSQ